MDEKWMGFIAGLVCGGLTVGIWYDTVKNWWWLRKLPYSWACQECVTNGGKYTCRSSSIVSLDNMVLDHKRESHDHIQ